MTAEPTPRTDAERMVKVPWEPTSEMIQAMENRQIEGATYIAEDSIQYALWKEVWKAALTVAEAEREGKANDSVPGMDIVIREIERARLHGPDLRTLDALDITLARAKAAEADFIQVHKNCIEARQRAENAERELSLAQSRLAEFHKLLDECKVSRRYSLTAGREWIDYPLAERLRIVLDANKLCDQEIAESYESLAEVEKDAARYRWLREHFRFSHDSLHELWFDENVSPHAAETICDREALDAAIDESIKRSSASSPS